MEDYTTGDTLPKVKTEALDDKLAEKLAEVKVETFFTLLCEIKPKALIDTLADRPTVLKIETLGKTLALKLGLCTW